MESLWRRPFAYVASPVDAWLITCQKSFTANSLTFSAACVFHDVNKHLEGVAPRFFNQRWKMTDYRRTQVKNRWVEKERKFLRLITTFNYDVRKVKDSPFKTIAIDWVFFLGVAEFIGHHNMTQSNALKLKARFLSKLRRIVSSHEMKSWEISLTLIFIVCYFWSQYLSDRDSISPFKIYDLWVTI